MKRVYIIVLFTILGLASLKISSMVYQWIIVNGITSVTFSLVIVVIMTFTSFLISLVGIKLSSKMTHSTSLKIGVLMVILISIIYSFYLWVTYPQKEQLNIVNMMYLFLYLVMCGILMNYLSSFILKITRISKIKDLN